jgi:hypothetical protein
MTTRRWMIAVAIVAIVMAWLVETVNRGSMGPNEWMGMLWIWVVHAVIAAVLSAPIAFFGRKRVRWSLLDLLAFILPFAVWLALMAANSVGKSLANLGEPFYFSFAVPIAALIRVIGGHHAGERALSVVLVALLCFAAAGVYWWTPSLPE